MKNILSRIVCFFALVFSANGQTVEKIQPIVAMHLLNYTSDESLEQLILKLPDYQKRGVNVLFLEVDYHFKFKSHPELIDAEGYITKPVARRLASACKNNGITLIPEFQCVGHQSWASHTNALLTKYPEFDLTPGAFPNNEGMYCREWDPTNPKVNKVVIPMMDEIIDAFQANGLHIGMDEVFLLGSPKSPTTVGKNPAELFANAVMDFYNHFTKEKNIQLYMWGDRLIDGSKYPHGEYESSMNGTSDAIYKIPKDIIICDWHYEPKETYPSINLFLENGFRVLPCSYVNPEGTKALIRYSLQQENPKMLGHLFSNWNKIPKDSLLIYPSITLGLEVLKEKRIWDVSIQGELPDSSGAIQIRLSCAAKNAVIYYTLDGTVPNSRKQKYVGPFKVMATTCVHAIAYRNETPIGDISTKNFEINFATGRKLTLSTSPSMKYAPKDGASVLVNGIVSTNSYSDGQWAGFEGNETTALIELSKTESIKEVSMNFFYNPVNWIYPPSYVEFWTSIDGINFSKYASKEITTAYATTTIPVKMEVDTKASMVKIVIPKRRIPSNAPNGAGELAWIFMDEIILK